MDKEILAILVLEFTVLGIVFDQELIDIIIPLVTSMASLTFNLLLYAQLRPSDEPAGQTSSSE